MRKLNPTLKIQRPTTIRIWAGLIAAAAGMFLSVLDITVNVALPDITNSLNTDLETIQWIIILYVGSMTALSMGLGSLGDAYGLKRVYIIGLLIYSLAMFLISIAPNLSLVLGFRVVQAVGNGLILVTTPAIVTQLFPDQHRGRALGVMMGLGTLGMIVGSVGGGVLVDTFGWRAIFLTRIPIGLAVVLYTLIALNNSPKPRSRPPLDVLGGLMLCIGLATLILFLTIGGRTVWHLPHVIALGLTAIVSLVIFIRVENSVSHPVLDMLLLKNRVLVPAILVSYLMFLSTFVNWFILPFYVTDVLNASARAWGIVLMLLTVTNAVCAPVGGWLSDKKNPAYTITAGVTISAIAIALFTTLNIDSSIFDVAMLMMLTGVGLGLFQAASSNLIMGNLPGNRLGMGGAIISLSRSLGTVSSVSIMGAIFSARLSAHSGVVSNSREFVSALQDLYVLCALIATIAIVISISYWPVAIGKFSLK